MSLLDVIVPEVENVNTWVGNAMSQAAATGTSFAAQSAKFTDALAQAAQGLGSANNLIGLNISTPGAPGLLGVKLPTTFTPTPLDFGASPPVGQYRVPDISGTIPTQPADFTLAAPTLLPGFTGSFNDTMEQINVPSAPSSPTVNLPGYPTFVDIQFPLFTDAAPVYDPNVEAMRFDLMVPSIVPFIDNDHSVVDLLTSRRLWLVNRATNGGTGLPPEIEQAIWDRVRDRESNLMTLAIQDAATQDAALGFMLPSGSIQAKIAKAQQDMYAKTISASRDIGIKQAEMVIDNINKSLQFLGELEGQLVQADMNYKTIHLEAAKYQTDAALKIYDAQIRGYMATLEAKKLNVEIYSSMIEAYKARVQAYAAIIDAEKTKSDYNRSLVALFEAQIRAEQAKVDIYKTQVEAVAVVARIEEFKIRKFEAEVGAYTAGVNAYTAEVSGKNAEIQGYSEQVRAYQAKVGAYGAEIDAWGKKYEVVLEAYKAQIEGDMAITNMYKARVEAAGVKSQAELGYASTLNFANASYTQAVSAYNHALVSAWGTAAQAHMSAQTLAVQTAKVNSDIMQTSRSMSLDAAKAGAQVYAQLAGSAMNVAHFGASVSSNAGLTGSVSESHPYKPVS